MILNVAYFPDLSSYSYCTLPSAAPAKVLNVGWLDKSHGFPKGKVDDSLLAKILFLCSTPVNRMRGWHHCPFCEAYPITVSSGHKELTLGDAEIRVQGEDEIEYAAPTLIYHYMRDHAYLPPQVFLSALETA